MAGYYKFSDYLKKRGFGEKVYKITIDAGFSCPNLDGKISDKGCVYCNNRAFSPPARRTGVPIEEQIKQGMKALKERYGADKFIAYFQAYSNTYGPLEQLKKTYDTVKQFKNIVGISVGTRPDCVDDKILGLIGEYSNDYEVWVEYGLQSSDDRTLKLINRGHSHADFLKAVGLTRKQKNIKICAHVILGLPGEGLKEMTTTASELARLKIEGVKIHPLHVVKGTELEKWYNQGAYKPLELGDYIDYLVPFLERLSPDTVIQRLTADCPKEFLAAPDWINNKAGLLAELDNKLRERDSFQGKYFKNEQKN